MLFRTALGWCLSLALVQAAPASDNKARADDSVTIPTIEHSSEEAFASVGPDGVFRSWAYNGTVLDAARLSNAQVNAWIGLAQGSHLEAWRQDQINTIGSSDGTNVSDNELFNPPAAIIPTAQLEAALNAGTTKPLISTIDNSKC
ncbi:hypothetical protein BX600DRAFT_437877 [Xylariales sp. PMI_506]|nr:hypothetical protein BX600DRAFT_437877 [Xylariales sp. PMI_506]